MRKVVCVRITDTFAELCFREARKRKILKGLHEAQDYALEIQKRWMLGRCDEDVIIFYSIEDNVVCIFESVIQEYAIGLLVAWFYGNMTGSFAIHSHIKSSDIK